MGLKPRKPRAPKLLTPAQIDKVHSLLNNIQTAMEHADEDIATIDGTIQGTERQGWPDLDRLSYLVNEATELLTDMMSDVLPPD